jgi:hypothetical protein
MTFADGGLGQTIYSQYQSLVNGVWTDIMGGNPVYGSSTASNVFALDSPFNIVVSYRARTYYYTTGQFYYSTWSNTVTTTITSLYWWIVPPTALETSMQLTRLSSSTAGSSTDTAFTPTTPAMPGNLEASIIIDDLEQLGTFRPFGKSTAIMVHGDVWGDEFDLNLFFQTSAAWAQFKTIRNLQAVVSPQVRHGGFHLLGDDGRGLGPWYRKCRWSHVQPVAWTHGPLHTYRPVRLGITHAFRKNVPCTSQAATRPRQPER